MNKEAVEALNRICDDYYGRTRGVEHGADERTCQHQFCRDIAIIRAALQQQEGQGWQPIETAPKDGTEILLTDGALVSCGYFCESVSRPRWMTDTGAPTHWMPLPTPPEPGA